MLLKWRQRERDLGVVLTNMQHISGEEVVKFLQDTLDCLFDILNTNQEVFGENIFEVLVRVCMCMYVCACTRVAASICWKVTKLGLTMYQ